jgi:hypothetical protein
MAVDGLDLCSQALSLVELLSWKLPHVKTNALWRLCSIATEDELGLFDAKLSLIGAKLVQTPLSKSPFIEAQYKSSDPVKWARERQQRLLLLRHTLSDMHDRITGGGQFRQDVLFAVANKSVLHFVISKEDYPNE